MSIKPKSFQIFFSANKIDGSLEINTSLQEIVMQLVIPKSISDFLLVSLNTNKRWERKETHTEKNVPFYWMLFNLVNKIVSNSISKCFGMGLMSIGEPKTSRVNAQLHIQTNNLFTVCKWSERLEEWMYISSWLSIWFNDRAINNEWERWKKKCTTIRQWRVQ